MCWRIGEATTDRRGLDEPVIALANKIQRTYMVIRLHLGVLWLCFVWWIGTVVAQTGSTLQFTLHHQLIHSESVGDILPRGVIHYDSKTNTAVYKAQSEMVDLTSGKGVYRIGIYDAKKKDLSPAAFTLLVRYFL